MKTHLSIALFTLVLMSNCFSQKLRTGQFIANSSSYPISGDVTYSEVNGIKTVRFEPNFSTVQGFKLEVFLSKGSTLNTGTDVKISLQPLDNGSAFMAPITGMRTFQIPTGVDMYDFDNVLIQCTSANELWGYANLCESQLDVSSNPIPAGLYRAEQDISSQSMVDVSVAVHFESSNAIELETGFEVPSTSEFVANVGSTLGCMIE